MPDAINIASCLPALAQSRGAQAAISVSTRVNRKLVYCSISFAELESLSNRYANGLCDAGIERGMRTLLMVRQGFDFVALVFSLFKMGAVPVLIDPGMGVARLLDCIRTVNLDAFVGIPLAQAVRVLRPGPFGSIERQRFVTVGRRWFWGGPTLADLTRNASDRFDPKETAANDTAAILFTSGSTGPAKGVVYEHGMFDAQVRMIQSTYGIEPGETDLPTFPLFALFSVAMGMTIVLPDMDPSHPARVRPENIVEAVRDRRVTNTFGSPALWKRVAEYCVAQNITLPTLRRILIAGAPVPPTVIGLLHRVILPPADIHTPYGATESLPVSTISGRQVVGDTLDSTKPATYAYTLRGAGTCVGIPVQPTRVCLLTITDGPISERPRHLVDSTGIVGEICVAGPSITREYYNLPRANAASKIPECATTWHRIGDVGYLDEQGRLWFCGRKAHRVQTSGGTLYTECIEPVVNQHPQLARSALVGVGAPGAQRPVLIVELQSGRLPNQHSANRLAAEIIELVRKASRPPGSKPEQVPQRVASEQLSLWDAELTRSQSTQPTALPPVLFHKSLPVDVRHNAKINRELLTAWAAKKLAIK